MPPFVATLTKLPAKSKALLGGGALAVALVAFFMFRIATAPSYELIASGIKPDQTGKVTAALDAAGVTYELRNNGTAVAVEKSAIAKARIALASSGVAGAGGSHPGFELLDKTKLGASKQQLDATYQRALEGEIATMIEQVDGVSSAQVQLVLPQDDLFVDQATPATASVLLQGDTLDPNAVRGIAQLVANSVQDLKTSNVTITDASGAMVWPAGDGAGGTGSSSRFAAEQRYNQSLQSSLSTMLTQAVGAGKFQVQARAQLNLDDTTQDTLTYAKKGVPLETTKETEKLKGTGAKTGGASGTANNVTGYAAAAGAGNGNSNYNRTSGTTKFGVDKTVQHKKIAGGDVKKLDVSVLVDKSVPAATIKALQQSVATAAGIDPARGDTVTVQAVKFAPFAKPVTPPQAIPVPPQFLGPLKWAGLAFATLLFMFFLSRHLRRREGESLAAPAWLTEIEGPVALAELEAPRRALPELPERQSTPEMHKLDQLMEREPERVAAHVRAWMQED